MRNTLIALVAATAITSSGIYLGSMLTDTDLASAQAVDRTVTYRGDTVTVHAFCVRDAPAPLADGGFGTVLEVQAYATVTDGSGVEHDLGEVRFNAPEGLSTAIRQVRDGAILKAWRQGKGLEVADGGL